MLLDSNIIIYAAQPGQDALRDWIAARQPVVSVVSYVEVLGYHLLSDSDKQALTEFFHAARILPVTSAVAERAILLRQQRRMSLGDSLIAATALVFETTLVAHNIADFEWVTNLQLFDPLAKDA